MDKRKILIDGDVIPYILTHRKKLLDESGFDFIKDDLGNPRLEEKTWEQVKSSTDSFLLNIFLKTQATHYLGALTVGKVNPRYKIYPEYKANRKYSEKAPHFDKCKEYLITEYGFVWDYELEADDIINICREPEDTIVSNDKDLLYLAGTHYNLKKNEFLNVNAKQANYEFWRSMCVGDGADNIKGVPGCGPRCFEKLFDPKEENLDMHSKVLTKYIERFGEELGIEEFYKNYKCLKLMTKDSKDVQFVIPEFTEIDYEELQKKINREENITKD